MLHILIGTKGQLIKMAPIMLELDKHGIEYNFINASQHSKVLNDLICLFGLKNPDHTLDGIGRDISTTKEGIRWMTKNLLNYGLFKSDIFNSNSNRKAGKDIVVLHGDATPALLGLIFAKRNNLSTAHIESGERTFNFREPFPEEIIRVFVDRHSEYLFACSSEAYTNLMNEKVRGSVYDIRYNTVFDSINIALDSNKSLKLPDDEYILASIHRYETISSKMRLQVLIDSLNRMAETTKVIFPLHESTKSALLSFSLMDSLSDNISVIPLLDYFSFINHIKNCKYMVTDGGGPQQETYYLGTPCLLLREHTEREGYPNVCLAGYDKRKIRRFEEEYLSYKQNPLNKDTDYSPSVEVVKILQNQDIDS